MAEILHALLAAAHNYEPVLIKYGMVVILAAITLEGVGIPLPGQSLLVAGALLSIHGEFDIRMLLLSAWLAALAGGVAGYLIGRSGGRKLLSRLPLNPDRMERMERFSRKHGTLLVTSSRFIDGPRQLAGLLAGSLQMPVTTFLLASGIGALLWVGFWGLGAFYFGEYMHQIGAAFRQIAPYTWLVTGTLILLAAIYAVRKHPWHK